MKKVSLFIGLIILWVIVGVILKQTNPNYLDTPKPDSNNYPILIQSNIDTWLQNVDTWLQNVATGNVVWNTTSQTDTLYGNYVVKTKQSDISPGENIYIYNQSWTLLLSLLEDENHALRNVRDIIWDYVILSEWTSASSAWLEIYNIQTKVEVLGTSYVPQTSSTWKSLTIEWHTVTFYHPVFGPDTNKRDVKKPNNLPTCPSDRDKGNIGYSELQSFDLTTQQLKHTGKFICNFVE